MRFFCNIAYAILLSLSAFSFAKDEVSVPVVYSVPSFAPFVTTTQFPCPGAASSILKNMLTSLNIQSELEVLPYARILHALSNNNLDVALIFKNIAIEESVSYLGPVSMSKVIVISDPDKPVNDYEDLAKLDAIAVIKNAQFESRFDQDNSINKLAVRSYEHGLQMFEKGRVDAIIGSDIGLTHAISQHNLHDNYIKRAFHLGDKAWYLHIAKGSKLLNHNESILKWLDQNAHPNLMLEQYLKHNKSCRSANVPQ